MRLALFVALFLACYASTSADLLQFRERASAIIENKDAEEITIEQARRSVQLLLKDFVAWAKTNDFHPEFRSRTYTVTADDPTDPLSIERCPLVFDEKRDELCLFDLQRSELWGGTVLFCRYLCE